MKIEQFVKANTGFLPEGKVDFSVGTKITVPEGAYEMRVPEGVYGVWGAFSATFDPEANGWRIVPSVSKGEKSPEFEYIFLPSDGKTEKIEVKVK